MKLMREVECEEKAVEQAKMEAAQSIFDIFLKMGERERELLHVEERNKMFVREVFEGKLELLRLCVTHELDASDRYIEVLDEMHRALEMKLSSALEKKKLENTKKQENEAFSNVALADQEIMMEKALEEFKKLEQEAFEISKLQGLLIDRGQVIDMISREIHDKCQYMNLIKEELDQMSSCAQTFLNNSNISSLEGSKNDIREEEQAILSSDQGSSALQSTTKSNYFGNNPSNHVVSKKRAAANGYKGEAVTYGILLIMIHLLLYMIANGCSIGFTVSSDFFYWVAFKHICRERCFTILKGKGLH